MKLQIIKPTTSSQRSLIKIKNKNLNKNFLLKKDVKGQKNSVGKNNLGKTTIYHKGGGHKQRYRTIDFYRNTNSIAIVTSIEYDPNRTAYITSIYDFIQKKYSYIIAPEKLSIGDIVKSGSNAEPKLGHSLPVSKIPVGSLIYNVSPKLKKPGQISRSAGTFSYLIEKTAKYGKIKISSGEQRVVSINCQASIGTVSNELHFLTNLGKAGRARWLNKRPTVRGVSMNPIDHPHGGGEGRKSGKNLTPWGKPNFRGATSKSKNVAILVKRKNGKI